MKREFKILLKINYNIGMNPTEKHRIRTLYGFRVEVHGGGSEDPLGSSEFKEIILYNLNGDFKQGKDVTVTKTLVWNLIGREARRFFDEAKIDTWFVDEWSSEWNQWITIKQIYGAIIDTRSDILARSAKSRLEGGPEPVIEFSYPDGRHIYWNNYVIPYLIPFKRTSIIYDPIGGFGVRAFVYDQSGTGLERVELHMDGTLLWEMNEDWFDYLFCYSSLFDGKFGSHKIQIKAYDNAGYVGISKIVRVFYIRP